MSLFLGKGENERKNPLLCKNLTSLAVAGIWPFQSDEFLENRRLRSAHFWIGFSTYCFYLLFVLAQFMELFHVWGNLEDATTNLSVSCLGIVGAAKIYQVYRHRTKLKILVEMVSKVETDILKSENDLAKKELKDYIKTARKFTYFFWSLVSSTIVIFFVSPPLEYRYSSMYHRFYENGTEYWTHKKPMVFSTWFPFDKYEFPNYLYAYAFHFISGCIGSLYHLSWDMFVVSMMTHTIGQLKILQLNLVNTTRPDSLTILKYERLVCCVNHHRYIMRYSKDLNSIISPIMLLYFVSCSVMFCCTVFQATLYGFSFRLWFMLEYFSALMVQLFLFYWHGNKTIVEKNKILLATYSCEWYNESKGFKTSLSILREGIKLPVQFSVGQFYEMSLPTFLAILRASYSYYALLRQVQDAK